MAFLDFRYGGGEIRTLETFADLAVFKTAALDHYATPPTRNSSKNGTKIKIKI